MAEKGCQDTNRLHEIIDESLLAHIAIEHDGCPTVIPISAWRVDDHIYIHGAKNSRLIRYLQSGKTCSLAFTLFDGWVLARSAYNHGAHYRSAVVFGQFSTIEDTDQKSKLLDDFINQIAPNRAKHVRSASASELAATAVLSMPLTEASVKISQDPVDDLPSDKDFPVWAGILPYRTQVGPLIADAEQAQDMPIPDYSMGYGDRWSK